MAHMFAAFGTIADALKKGISRNRNDSSAIANQSAPADAVSPFNSAAQDLKLTASSSETRTSQWQVLRAKIQASDYEQAAAKADVDDLLQNVFRERVLANHPELSSYFKAHAAGPALEAYTLAKARAAAATCPPPGTHPRFLNALRRGLAAYRCWRPRVVLHLILTRPEYSPLAAVLGWLLVGVVLLNTVTFCMESVPRWEGTEVYDTLVKIDYACVGVFTAELLLRVATCSSVVRLLGEVSTWVDVVAVAPFWVELAVAGPDAREAGQARIVRLLRLLRVMRMMRATKRFRHIQLVGDALLASGDVILMLGVLLVVLLVVTGAVMFFVEGALAPDGGTLDSIPLAMYYMHTTLTTTGYGDFFPLSPAGRAIAGFFMLACMVTMSLPIGVVGGTFSSLWSAYRAAADSLARAAGAWAGVGRVRALAGGQAGAADELLGAVNRTKITLEDGPEDGRVGGLGLAREMLLALQAWAQRALAAAENEDPAQLAALRDGVAQLRAVLEAASCTYGELQALLAVWSRLCSLELSEQLDSIHLVSRELAGDTARGEATVGRAGGLLRQLREMRGVLEEEERVVAMGGTEAWRGKAGKGEASG